MNNKKDEIMIVADNSMIQKKIYTIRGMQVMLDRDLAKLYQVETKVLNQAVKRNIDRFPKDFMFHLTKKELSNWKSQFVTSNNDKMGLRRPPYAFTEQGVSMLSAILRSKVAIDVSIKIIRAFVRMRKYINSNANIFNRLSNIEEKIIASDVKQIETDQKFEQIFKAIEEKSIKPKQGIFFDGQIFDAYKLLIDIIKKADKSIFIIDNYIDESILILLTKRKPEVDVKIFTKNITKQMKLDIEKYNEQYPKAQLIKLNKAHDRFIVIDNKEVYHLGASFKDLGKKWFAFTKMDNDSLTLIEQLNKIMKK